MIWDTCLGSGLGREWCFLELCTELHRGEDVALGDKTTLLGQRRFWASFVFSRFCWPEEGATWKLQGSLIALNDLEGQLLR